MDEFIIESGLYVDDMNIVFYPLPPGTRWSNENKKMVIEDGYIEDDRRRPADERSMTEMKKMANSICPIIQMDEDYPSRNPDGKLPILDLKVWITDGIILHQFYRKSMASRMLMMSTSAMPRA